MSFYAVVPCILFVINLCLSGIGLWFPSSGPAGFALSRIPLPAFSLS